MTREAVGMSLLVLLAACSESVARHRIVSADPNRASVRHDDPARHTVQMVEVAPKVSLEVLDYGGTGVPVIFLAGLGNTAHVFDDFAPRLTDRHHVYAITRRGFGASSKPDRGYDLATRVADDLAVLSALGLERAIWIGHSVAGDELTALAATSAARVTMLVYLDATSDHGLVAEQRRRGVSVRRDARAGRTDSERPATRSIAPGGMGEGARRQWASELRSRPRTGPRPAGASGRT